MDVNTEKLAAFLGKADETFSIPLFQRPYSWDEWQCQVLWNDICHAGKTEAPHFFGAILFRKTPCADGTYDLSLIDGQQRILSMLLLLAALRDHLLQNPAETDDINAQLIEKTFLHAGDMLKARPTARDYDAFEAAMFNRPRQARGKMSDETSRVFKNKQFFRKQMDEPGFDAVSFWRGIGLLSVATIGLTSDDDVQAIFESFNSKGVPLVTADLVRNYLLLSENPEEQERLYNEHWLPMQALFGDDPGSLRINNAIRAWTVIRCKTPHARSDVQAFDDFKQYAQNEYDGTVETLMDELHGFCAVWAENYRYHAVKKYRSADWAKLGRKTLVSGMTRSFANPEARAFYEKHYGVSSHNAAESEEAL